jgi:GH25 family lysozyme M1 (1,4-beta-N-acetylmuramidase)
MKAIRFFSVGVASVFLGCVIFAAPERAAAQRPMGIDVSHYQSVINWSNVAGGGITFAWCKATEGLTYTDPTFVSNVLHAKAANIPIGLYHFARPDTHIGLAGADAEAAFFWSTISNYVIPDGKSLMPMLDYETAPGGSYTKASSSAWVNEWCQQIVNYGASNGLTVIPVVYTYVSFTSSWLDTSVTNWPLWMASYNGRNPQTGNPSSTSPWSTWQFWQYSSSLSVPGINNGSCDTDVYNGTADGLANYIVGGGPPTITMQPSNVTVIEGGTATFSVTATTSPLTYQWSFNGTNIDGATNSTFSVSNAPQSATGQYSVDVSGPTDTVTSSNALLTVIPMISNVLVVPRSSSAIITWNTATNASGQAMYSLDTSYSSVLPVVPTLTTQHSALLVGLQSSMTYNYQLVSSNSPYGGMFTGSFSTEPTLIVQASQAMYSGIWTIASAAPDKYSPYYEYAASVSGSDSATAFFRPNIVTPGKYDVYLWYSVGSNRSQGAPVTVGYQGGSVENFIDETTNGGSWQLLVAGVPFAVGTNGYVRLGNGSGESGKVVIADAVKLVYSAGQDLPANNSPPSWWLSYYFGTNSVDPSQDSDGDRYSALAEYVIGTDPTDSTSYLHVRGQSTPDGSGVQVIFSPYYFNSGRQYQLQSRPSVTNGVWTNLPLSPVTTNSNGEGVLTATNLVGSQNFLRVSVLMTQ